MIALALSLCLWPDPLADLHRFPPADQANSNWIAASRHRSHLRELALCYSERHAAYFQAWEEEACYCCRCWDVLDWAYKSNSDRQRWLNQLRDLLGEVDFMAGHMPPALPYWRFQRID